MWVGVFALGSMVISAVVHQGRLPGPGSFSGAPGIPGSAVSVALVSSCSVTSDSVTMLNPAVNHSGLGGPIGFDEDHRQGLGNSGVAIQLVNPREPIYDVIPPRMPPTDGNPAGAGRLLMHLGMSETRSDFVNLVNAGRTATLTSSIPFQSSNVSSRPFTIQAGQELRDISLLVRELGLSRDQFVVFTINAEWASAVAPNQAGQAATYSAHEYYCFLVMADPNLDEDEAPLPTEPRWTVRLDRLGVFVAGGADGGSNPAAQLRGDGSDSFSRVFIGSGSSGDSASGGKGFCGALQSRPSENWNLNLSFILASLGIFYWRRRLLSRAVKRS